jgi:hypothetical protein
MRYRKKIVDKDMWSADISYTYLSLSHLLPSEKVGSFEMAFEFCRIGAFFFISRLSEVIPDFGAPQRKACRNQKKLS